jgi:DNA-binding winged helix-turn-helix (wHTH) protein
MAASMDVRFGEFEFSLDSLKLRRAGAEVRLVGQPLHLLVMLLQTPGKVVTREEIRQRLWPDTHVDFDHGLNVALNRLRVALGDKGKQSQFIETIPTMGYRFLAPVEVLVPAGPVPEPPRSSARIRVAWFVLTAIVAALLALAIVRQHYDKFVPRSGQDAR